MKKHVKKYLVPHKGNDYHPHFWRAKNLSMIAILVLGLFSFSVMYGSVLLSSNFLASILPSVLVEKANASREVNSIGGLRINERLVQAAQLKANDMATNSYFAHNSPTGVTPWHWFDVAGYDFLYAGENLAVDFVDSDRVHQAWLDSPGHRANILNGNFTEIGIASAEGRFEGRDTIFVVQMFGRPKPVFDLELADNSGDVASANEVNEVSIDEEISNEMFIAVEASELPPLDSIDLVENGEGEALGAESDTSFFLSILTSPRKTLTYVYIFLAGIIIVALLFAMISEVRKHHRKHLAYAILLLVLIAIVIYLNKSILSGVLIA